MQSRQPCNEYILHNCHALPLQSASVAISSPTSTQDFHTLKSTHAAPSATSIIESTAQYTVRLDALPGHDDLPQRVRLDLHDERRADDVLVVERDVDDVLAGDGGQVGHRAGRVPVVHALVDRHFRRPVYLDGQSVIENKTNQ